MSLALSSSLSPFSVPLSSQRRPIGHGAWRIKAMAAEGRESLDHLQRAVSKTPPPPQQQQIQPAKRRMATSAPLGLWDRFPTARTVQQMMDTMDRIMEDPFAFGTASTVPSLGGDDGVTGSYRRGRTPWEIKEGQMEYKMRFDMPGMTKKDVRVWVEENMLVLKAEKLPKKDKEGDEAKEEEEEEEEWSPRSYGRYSSRIALPDNVVVEKIKAEVKDGVLYVTVPKASPSSKVVDIDVQ